MKKRHFALQYEEIDDIHNYAAGVASCKKRLAKLEQGELGIRFIEKLTLAGLTDGRIAFYGDRVITLLKLIEKMNVNVVDAQKKDCESVLAEILSHNYKGNSHTKSFPILLAVTSDSWSAWNHVGKTHQRCQWHYLNDLEDTMQYKNPGKEFASFAKCLKRILYASQGVTLKKKEDRMKIKKNLEQRIQRLVCKKYTDRHCVRFVKRLRREKRMLFTFLDGTTGYHNNAAERAVRPNGIIRKITNGHRSENGACAHKILMSIKETCRMRGLNFYDYALEYLGRIASKS